MKKILFMFFVLGFLFTGCSSISRSEFLQHSSHYENFEHMGFSWFGYKHPTRETGEESDAEGWWGIPIEVKNPD